MSAKLIFLLLAALLLVQCSVGAESKVDRKSSKESSVENNVADDDGGHENTVCEEFVVEKLLNFVGIHTFTNAAYMQLHISHSKTGWKGRHALHMLKNRLSPVHEAFSKLPNLIYKEQLPHITQLVAVVDKYNTTGVENPETEVLIIEESLKNNGAFDLVRKLKSESVQFFEYECLLPISEQLTIKNLVGCDSVMSKNTLEEKYSALQEIKSGSKKN